MLVTAEADTEVQSAGTVEPVFMKPHVWILHIQASNVCFFYFEIFEFLLIIDSNSCCSWINVHNHFYFTDRRHSTWPTFSSRSLICLLWISVLSSRSRILCKIFREKNGEEKHAEANAIMHTPVVSSRYYSNNNNNNLKAVGERPPPPRLSETNLNIKGGKVMIQWFLSLENLHSD